MIGQMNWETTKGLSHELRDALEPRLGKSKIERNVTMLDYDFAEGADEICDQEASEAETP
jgi:hypothetical protein